MATMKSENVHNDPTYWLSRNDAETRRLILQSRFINPFTASVLRQAGVTAGMNVLDIGSGAGDVAMLLADLVGSSGSVVGVDLNPEVLEIARARASNKGLTNVKFIAGDCRAVDAGSDFDAVVGRLVLTYVSDPVETLRSLLERLRPGGIVAFQEYNPDSIWTCPSLPTWERVRGWITAAALEAGLDLEVGFRLHQHFVEAGLPPPRMQVDSQAGGGPDWEGYSYLAACFESMLPLVLTAGIATADDVDIQTLADRLRDESVAAGGVVKVMDLVSAWSRKPSTHD